MSENYHTSVMVEEIISFMRQGNEAQVYIDATLGEGGHSAQVLRTFPHVFCIGIDADDAIMERARNRLANYKHRTRFHTMWFDEYFSSHGQETSASYILFDLGVSTYHYFVQNRGFSFDSEDALDMRVSQTQSRSAEDLLYNCSEKELADILYLYGEERNSRKIARAIHKHLIEPSVRPISCKALSYVVKGCFAKERRYRFPHPATKVFQALRIAVNNELERLKRVLYDAAMALEHLGMLLVISFHSLEDRIVKNFFRSHEIQSMGANSPDRLQLCILTKKVLRATESEIKMNPASRSAKLRVAQRIVHG